MERALVMDMGVAEIALELNQDHPTNPCMPIEQDSQSVWLLAEIRSIGNLSFQHNTA